MLDRLVIPPRLMLRALEDLHVIAQNLPALREAAAEIPRSEKELAGKVDLVNERVEHLLELIEPLHAEITDVDETAENLEASLSRLHSEVRPLQPEVRQIREQIASFHEEIRDLRDRIPGI